MPRLNLPKERVFVGPALIWKRCAAFLIDLMIINLIIWFPFGGFFDKVLPAGASFTESLEIFQSSEGIISIVFVMCILAMLYFVMLERKMGQTVGKHLMNIYVISDSTPIKTWQAYVRNIYFLPIFPFIILWALDPLFMLFSKSNQRLSDILSKTRVVQDYNM